MGQRRPVVAVTALLCVCVLFGRADSSDFSYVKREVESAKYEDSLQPGVHTDVLDSGETFIDRKGMVQKMDMRQKRRIFDEKRDRTTTEGGPQSGTSASPTRSSMKGSVRNPGGPMAAAGLLGTLSEQGLRYVKDVMVGEILDEVTPLAISDINARVNSPIGRLDTAVTHIVLSDVTVQYSEIDLDEGGITIFAAGIEASLKMHWEYHYTASYVPFPISDGGWADVQVSGMQAGVAFTLGERDGTLRLIVKETGTYIESLDIVLHGGASWLYQWFVYAFDYNIRSSVQVALTDQLVSAAEQFDDWLLNLPRAVPIDETSALNVTVVQDPILSPTFLSVGAKGQFIALDSTKYYPDPDTVLPAGLFCDDSVKMVTLALSDYVLNSAAFVYYDSGELQWDVDTAETKYLNTASWRYIIPQLYKKYPNKDMAINFAVSSAPVVDIRENGIWATAGADMTIEVKDEDSIIPVACINLVVSFDAVASLTAANITGQASLDELSLDLKWSDIGSFPMYLVQATVRAIVKDVVLPLININLKRGFPLPVITGVEIENANLRYADGYILVCSDIRYKGGLIKDLKNQEYITSKL